MILWRLKKKLSTGPYLFKQNIWMWFIQKNINKKVYFGMNGEWKLHFIKKKTKKNKITNDNISHPTQI